MFLIIVIHKKATIQKHISWDNVSDEAKYLGRAIIRYAFEYCRVRWSYYCDLLNIADGPRCGERCDLYCFCFRGWSWGISCSSSQADWKSILISRCTLVIRAKHYPSGIHLKGYYRAYCCWQIFVDLHGFC